MSNKLIKGLLFTKTEEIEIQVAPKTLKPIIEKFTRGLHSNNYAYEVRLASLKSKDTFVWYDVFVIEPGIMKKRAIGALTLQAFRGNRTLLRVPPLPLWRRDGGLTPDESIVQEFNGPEHDELFRQFFEGLEDRLSHYGLKITLRKRIRHWFYEARKTVKTFCP